MSEACSPQRPIATWNPERKIWETETLSLFSEHSEPYSATWPSSGMTRSGAAYALPTWAPHTDASACSSWQPRPEELTAESAWMAGLFEGEGYITVRKDTKAPRILLGMSMTDEDVIRKFAALAEVGTVRGPYKQRGLGTKPTYRWTITTANGSEMVLNRIWLGLCSRRRAKAIEAMTMVRGGQMDLPSLLPTPAAARSGNNQSPSPGAAVRPSLDSINHLLPTPRATDGTKGGPNQKGSSGDLMLPSAVQLLPTPTVSDANGAGAHGDGGKDLRTTVSLLPTPTARDGKGPNQRQDRTCLHGALLPTPTVADSRGTRNATAGRKGPTNAHGGQTLTDVFWTGDRTPPQSDSGNTSSGDLPLSPQNPDVEATES